jgi:hypothetical protein
MIERYENIYDAAFSVLHSRQYSGIRNNKFEYLSPVTYSDEHLFQRHAANLAQEAQEYSDGHLA